MNCRSAGRQWARSVALSRRTAANSSANPSERSAARAGWQRVDYLKQIVTANVYGPGVSVETPLTYAHGLSQTTKNTVLLKREDTQPVFSFKSRGAFNAITSLSDAQKKAGIVACSAGNHAQGVALSASKLGLDNKIVMPLATPAIKVDAVRKFGGNVVLHGQNYDEAQALAMKLVEEENRTLIHPFDDPNVIAGQGTIGLEIIKERMGRPLDAIYVCCGGGGMLAGIAAYVKAVRPDVKVYGVEAEDAPGMTLSLQRGEVTELKHIGLFADGAAVKRIGKETFRVCHELVDGMVTVDTDEICAGIKAAFNDCRVVLEPAGALAVAGVRKHSAETGARGRTLVAITSGANMDFTRLRFVSERADEREVLLSVSIPEQPGAFREMYKMIYPRNVTEFSYRANDNGVAHIILSFQALTSEHPSGSRKDADDVTRSLRECGYSVVDLSSNDMAKTHGRYLAGGRCPTMRDERLFRFTFPEQPGALNRFLNALQSDEDCFNVTLFHYRNHGADIGRVLVAMQVTDSDRSRFNRFLEELSYDYIEETANPIYKQFMLR